MMALWLAALPLFTECLTGPIEIYDPEVPWCHGLDENNDGHMDLRDWAIWTNDRSSQ